MLVENLDYFKIIPKDKITTFSIEEINTLFSQICSVQQTPPQLFTLDELQTYKFIRQDNTNDKLLEIGSDIYKIDNEGKKIYVGKILYKPFRTQGSPLVQMFVNLIPSPTP